MVQPSQLVPQVQGSAGPGSGSPRHSAARVQSSSQESVQSLHRGLH